MFQFKIAVPVQHALEVPAHVQRLAHTIPDTSAQLSLVTVFIWKGQLLHVIASLTTKKDGEDTELRVARPPYVRSPITVSFLHIK
jgi:hypothetical protein